MIDRLEERQAILAKLQSIESAKAAADAAPEVVAAAERMSAARKALRAAEREFELFRDAARARVSGNVNSVMAEHPDLMVAGYEYGDDHLYPVVCAATGLPLFKGDALISRDPAMADDYLVHVLRSAVSGPIVEPPPALPESESQDDDESLPA